MTDWETRYYEQRALFTESNGMLTDERNRAIARAEAAEAKLADAIRERDEVREELEALYRWERGIADLLEGARIEGRRRDAYAERLVAGVRAARERLAAPCQGFGAFAKQVRETLALIDAALADKGLEIGVSFCPHCSPCRHEGKAQDAMLRLASWLGHGPGGGEFTTVEDMEARIRQGVDMLTRVEAQRRASLPAEVARAITALDCTYARTYTGKNGPSDQGYVSGNVSTYDLGVVLDYVRALAAAPAAPAQGVERLKGIRLAPGDAFRWAGDLAAFEAWYGSRCPVDFGGQISVPTKEGGHLRVWHGSWIVRHNGTCYTFNAEAFDKFIRPHMRSDEGHEGSR